MGRKGKGVEGREANAYISGIRTRESKEKVKRNLPFQKEKGGYGVELSDDENE